ncbi:MAG: radical SAM protein [Gammaproteobacteria bacterium]|nr:radical SAM protein [Gammaproteobacteria bacterium]
MAHVGIEITSRCNMACAMCSHPVMKRAKMDMPWERFERVVSDIAANGHELRGMQMMGEPLLAVKYCEAVGHLRDNGVPVTNAFYTNAELLTPKLVEKMAFFGWFDVHKATKKIWLGVDTMNPKEYARLRGGDFDKVVHNIENFCRCVKHYSLPGLAIQRMQTKWNPDEPIEAFERFGVPVVTRRVGRHAYKDRDLCVIPFSNDRRAKCREQWGTIYIGSHGGATSCCIDAEFEHEIGNVDDMTIAEIDIARAAQQIAFKRKDYSGLSLCQRCTGMEPAGI